MRALHCRGSVLCSEKQRKCGSGGAEAGGSTEKLEVGIETGEEELLKDVVAKDDRDGDVSDSVMISKIEKKKDGEENEFVISYVGFDKSSNSGTLTRDLIYTDYRKPHFALSEELRFPETRRFPFLIM